MLILDRMRGQRPSASRAGGAQTDVDSLNLAFANSLGSFDGIIDLLVPELTRRGPYKNAYAPGTLRKNCSESSCAPECSASGSELSPHVDRHRWGMMSAITALAAKTIVSHFSHPPIVFTPSSTCCASNCSNCAASVH